jgi:secreted PhoX family phosphatase
VADAEYLFTGAEGYERFCSATLRTIDGRPLYFTGEEAVNAGHDGSSVVLDPETGQWRETKHFGRLQHENIVPLRLSKWVFLTSEDDFRAGLASYLYAYIANDFNRALRGRDGGLYVWKADDPAKTGNATVAKGESVPGHFVPISQAENATSDTLKAASDARRAFRFDRLEDIAVRPDVAGRTYIADTGKLPATLRGRVYQFDVDPRDPTRATLKLILNGDAPDGDDIVNPDNMDASGKVLVIQEDREAAFRGDPNRVLVYDFASKSLRTVARVQGPGLTAAPFNWESSGVIDASGLLGRNWWLLDVQAHTLRERQPGPTLEPNTSTGEDGQLLALYIPGSTGGGREDDD